MRGEWVFFGAAPMSQWRREGGINLTQDSDLNQAMENSQQYLSGQLLIAMPGMKDPRFAKTVIYMCAHSADGAMGLVINKVLDSLSFPDLLEQLGLECSGVGERINVHFGGPVESGRGFVLHTSDYAQDATLVVDGKVGLTATVDILKAIAAGSGPRRRFLALGYFRLGTGATGFGDHEKRLAERPSRR